MTTMLRATRGVGLSSVRGVFEEDSRGYCAVFHVPVQAFTPSDEARRSVGAMRRFGSN
jgi:hypothetical protein